MRNCRRGRSGIAEKHTGITAQGLVSREGIVGGSTDPVVRRVVWGVRGFPVERRHGEVEIV